MIIELSDFFNNPSLIELGPLKIQYYAVTWLISAVLIYIFLKNNNVIKEIGLNEDAVNDMVFLYGLFFGAICGGRIGYMLFYGFENLLKDPFSALKVWQGGMSFHGGLLGVLFAVWFYARKTDRTFFEITDFIAPSIPLALGLGRLGNFANTELPGRVTDVPWALIFPDGLARHPSSLYQAFAEGLILFLLLWWFAGRPRPLMAVSGLFLVAYGCFRFTSEFFREPDIHMGFLLADWVSAGQLLSIPMVFIGLTLLALSYRRTTGKV